MINLIKMGFDKKKTWRKKGDTAIATFAGGLTGMIPGVPIGAGIIAGIAPKKHKTEIAAKASIGGYLTSAPVAAYGIHTLAKDVSKTNKADYIRLKDRALQVGKDFKKGKRLSTIKHVWNRSKGATKKMYLANIALGAIGTGIAYHVVAKPYYKQAGLVKLGFHPESFTRPSYEKDQAFLASYGKPGVVGKVRQALNSPLTWALGGISLFMSHKKRSDNPESVWPYLTGSILAVIAIKRWVNASKREKQKFVKEYNTTMGTTFTLEHPKMQSLWNMTNAKANKIDRPREM